MNINNISDKIVFRMLKHIKHGVLELTNHDKQKYVFGTDSTGLDVSLKINKPGFTYKIIKSGSVGLAEAYMRGDFETNNLSNLIELTAKNINIIYKFSGIFDFPLINMIKNFLVKNTKTKSISPVVSRRSTMRNSGQNPVTNREVMYLQISLLLLVNGIREKGI